MAYRFSDIGGSNEKPFCLYRIIVSLLHIFWKIFWHSSFNRKAENSRYRICMLKTNTNALELYLLYIYSFIGKIFMLNDMICYHFSFCIIKHENCKWNARRSCQLATLQFTLWSNQFKKFYDISSLKYVNSFQWIKFNYDITCLVQVRSSSLIQSLKYLFRHSESLTCDSES